MEEFEKKLREATEQLFQVISSRIQSRVESHLAAIHIRQINPETKELKPIDLHLTLQDMDSKGGFIKPMFTDDRRCFPAFVIRMDLTSCEDSHLGIEHPLIEALIQALEERKIVIFGVSPYDDNGCLLDLLGVYSPKEAGSKGFRNYLCDQFTMNMGLEKIKEEHHLR